MSREESKAGSNTCDSHGESENGKGEKEERFIGPSFYLGRSQSDNGQCTVRRRCVGGFVF